MIRLDNLNVTLGGRDILSGISFDVPQGQSFGLVGESGSGKSTILRAIAGLVPIRGGAIAVGGRQLAAGGARDGVFLRQVQMVFQDPYGSLHPRHRVDRVLAEPLRIQRQGDVDRRIRRALTEVGLGEEHLSRYPHQLSGGQRQRIAIARALITEPQVLLLDEPTSALDVSVQAEILNLLQDLRRKHGLTYIFVSHNLPVIAHICDRVGILADGRLMEIVSSTALTRGQMESAAARTLLLASKGYRRDLRQAPPIPTLQQPSIRDEEDILATTFIATLGLR